MLYLPHMLQQFVLRARGIGTVSIYQDRHPKSCAIMFIQRVLSCCYLSQQGHPSQVSTATNDVSVLFTATFNVEFNVNDRIFDNTKHTKADSTVLPLKSFAGNF
jgi:hypothetical protein